MPEKIDFSTLGFLVVDKNPLSAELVRDILSVLGCKKVRVVRNTQRAVDLLKSGNFDIVITEYNVEPMNGVELTDHLRNSTDSPNRQVPILMLTANSELDYVRRARDAGVSEFLAKPFQVEDLYRRLVSMITQPRAFVNAEGYFGPDRRRRQMPFDGPDRRVGV